jgi:hypothetical protein
MARKDARYDEFLENLDAAHRCAQRALDALYRPGGPKRSLLYRMLLGRAQSILIGLYVQEINRKDKE